MQSDSNNSAESHFRCCVCFDNSDNWSGVLVQCSSCAIHVHTRCYGLSDSTDLQTWQCERCLYLQNAPQDTSDDENIIPYCAICPIEGGALKQSIHTGVWCHVVCSSWIPELSHAIKANSMNAIDLSLLDPSREGLRCLVCGQRGGCIQCLSKRCARSFHVMCAIRSPSSLVFTGYDRNNHQSYHCHVHAPEVLKQNDIVEIVDTKWRKKRQLQELLDTRRNQAGRLVDGNGKCNICNAKVGTSALVRHEVKCMLTWLTAMEMDARKKALEKTKQPPVQIPYQSSMSSLLRSETTTASIIKQSSFNPDQKILCKNSVEKKNHSLPVRRPCPKCGDLIKETYMISHLRRRCSQNPESTHCKRGRLKKSYIKRRSFSNKNGTTYRRNLVQDNALEYGSYPSTNATEEKDSLFSCDVLFSSWPGQTTGDRMDTSFFWTIVHNYFYCSTISDTQQLDRICRDFCGSQFSDLTTRPKSGDLMECKLTAVITREYGAGKRQHIQCLYLDEMIHQCDFMMRSSCVKCPEDFESRLQLEVAHEDKLARHLSIHQTIKQKNGKKIDIYGSSESERLMASPKSCLIPQAVSRPVSIQFKNRDFIVRGLLHLHLLQDKQTLSDDLPKRETVWSKYTTDSNLRVVGADLPSVINSESSTNLWTSLQLLSACPAPYTSTDVTVDELTPQINFLIENVCEQARRNRTKLQSICFRFKSVTQTQTKSQFDSEIVGSYYKELAWWKVVCKSMIAGFSLAISLRDRSLGSKNSEYLDDGTCVVCFDGQSPEANPIIFCDRCDLAVHQHCYGITKVPSNEFLCDRCKNQDGSRIPTNNAISKVFCQLCPVQDGALKQTVDGKWVHAVCALWCPGVWIGNLFSMTGINLATITSSARFIDTLAEIEAICRQSRQSLSTDEAKLECLADTAAIHRLKKGFLCIFCRISCGRTIQCSFADCRCSFHPLCAWYAGVPMFLEQSTNTVVYAGGGAGPKFSILCHDHANTVGADRQYILDQRARRRRLRIDLYYRTSSKKSRYREARQSTADQSPKETNEPALSSLSWDGIHEDTEFCTACFHYASPSTDEKYPEKVHGRQFLIRCQQCHIIIHAACAISQIGSFSDSVQSDWVCEKCKLTTGNDHAPSCIVCDESGDYMMPCVEVEVSTSWQFKERIRELLSSAGSGVRSQSADVKKLAGGIGSPIHKGEWMHVFCSKWIKARYIRRDKILFALKSFSTANHSPRCDICLRKTVSLMSSKIVCEVYKLIFLFRISTSSAKIARKNFIQFVQLDRITLSHAVLEIQEKCAAHRILQIMPHLISGGKCGSQRKQYSTCTQFDMLSSVVGY